MTAGGRTPRAPLAIVLHTHMPYVHGYGTWPYGEEWLWEVYASSYLPVSALVAAGAPLTISLTPVVADQLEAPAAAARCRAFYDEQRRQSHAEDQAGLADGGLTAELAASHHSWREYEAAITQIDQLGGDLLAPLAATATWTSSATHAVLPLLATEAGIRFQVGTGVNSHRRRTGRWGGGLWLPECAWDPEIEAALVEEGVRSICVELTTDTQRGPWQTPNGLRIAPIDRPLIDAVWHHEGYPAHADYRSSHGRSYQGHALWANHGGAYDPDIGAARARAHAADWAARCADALADGRPRVVAFDTELFGHWWHEGPTFLAAAIDELEHHGVQLLQLDDLIAATELPTAPAPPASTWGAGRDLRTWSAPKVASIAWELRRAELDLLLTRNSGAGHVADAALRDLLALQSSDWAFMVTEHRAAEYGWARFADHRRATTVPAGSLPSSAPRLRHLAPDLATGALAVG